VAVPQKELLKIESTRSDIVIPVDYNDAGAVDPGPDDLFWSQLSVDKFLERNGATNFKHLASAYEALPQNIAHNITFNLAIGIHRPRPTDTNDAWPINGKTCVGTTSSISIIGTSPSSWNLIDPSLEDLSILSLQAGSGDPYVTISGTPFLGFDLKGWYAVFDTGQVAPIHDHTNDTLYITNQISPVPTTVSVMSPSTIFRNSLNDVTKVATSGCLTLSTGLDDVASFVGGSFYLNNILIQQFDAYHAAWGGSGLHRWTNVLADHNNDPIKNGGSFYIGYCLGGILSSCIQRASTAATDGAVSFGNATIALISGCYLRGGQDGVWFDRVDTGGIAHSVLDNVADGVGEAVGWASLVLQNSRSIELSEYDGGKRNEIRGGGHGITGMRIDQSRLRDFFGSRMRFKDIPGPCVEIYPETVITVLGTTIGSGNPAGFINAGGNLDVGIQLNGPYSGCVLGTATDVTGANGDVRFKGGDIRTYADIVANGPYTDLGFNVVSKEP